MTAKRNYYRPAELPALGKNHWRAMTPQNNGGTSFGMLITATTEQEPWAVKLQQFPAELKDKPIWCVWRYLVREGKPTKVPMQVNGRMAKSNDPQTWAPFADACAAADADGELGVGVFCDGSFTFIDLDHCRDAETGGVEPWATRILNRVVSFRE
jgi:hypothetical protein